MARHTGLFGKHGNFDHVLDHDAQEHVVADLDEAG